MNHSRFVIVHLDQAAVLCSRINCVLYRGILGYFRRNILFTNNVAAEHLTATFIKTVPLAGVLSVITLKFLSAVGFAFLSFRLWGADKFNHRSMGRKK